MRISHGLWGVIAVVLGLVGIQGMSGSAFATPITVDSVGVLDPNPNNLTLVDAASNTSNVTNGVTLANFQTLITGAFASNTGGVLDFQEQYQGGPWPNNGLNSPNNGITVGNGSANTITATYGVSQSSSMGFFRNNLATDGIDAAVNQNTNVISGGYTTRTGGGSGNVDFSVAPPNPVATGGTSGIGGGYMGIVGNAGVELDFNNGLAAFGITALPRGSSRHTQFTLTLSDNSTIVSSNDLVTTSAVFWGFGLTPAQLASGLSITKVAFAQPDGVNRYDDLAFVVAVPEPGSIALMAMGGVGFIATVFRRREN